MSLFKAEDARQLAHRKHEQQVREVLSQVSVAAEAGLYQIELERRECTQGVQNLLEDLGYYIKPAEAVELVVISW
jgi:hypothetical protein